jgi:hypothetical protein
LIARDVVPPARQEDGPWDAPVTLEFLEDLDELVAVAALVVEAVVGGISEPRSGFDSIVVIILQPLDDLVKEREVEPGVALGDQESGEWLGGHSQDGLVGPRAPRREGRISSIMTDRVHGLQSKPSLIYATGGPFGTKFHTSP